MGKLNMERLARVRSALFGHGIGRTTAALVEALERCRDLDGSSGRTMWFVIPVYDAVNHVSEQALALAEELGIYAVRRKRNILVLGSNELRFISLRQLLHGHEMLGRGPVNYVADVGCLDLLWKTRRP